MFKNALLSAAVVSALAAGSLTMPSAAHATAIDPAGKYTAVKSTRIADSRHGTRIAHRLSAGQTMLLPVAGVAGVPAQGVQAVVVNITAVNPAARGYLTAYASGSGRPATSSANYPKGWTGATTATVPVGADGKIALYAGDSSVDLLVDVQGWYASATSTAKPGSLYFPGEPERLMDTRTDGEGPMEPFSAVAMAFSFSDLPAGDNVTGLALNVTAVGRSTGYFSLGDPSADTLEMPTTSVVNFAAGETAPNFTVAPVQGNNTDGYVFEIDNYSNGTADLIVDVVGVYFTSTDNKGLTHQSFAPRRVADTRSGVGITKGPLGAKTSRQVALPAGLADDRTWAVEGTLTGANPTANTYLTASHAAPGSGAPAASTLNLGKGKNRSNAFTTEFSPVSSSTPQFAVYNGYGSTDVIADLSGRFQATDELVATLGTKGVRPSAARMTATLPAFSHLTVLPAKRTTLR